jgi:hypothetical protein
MSKAKRAEKRGLTPRKFALARAHAFTNKTVECLAMIYSLTPRQVRRKIEDVYRAAGVTCSNGLSAWFAAHDEAFQSEEERQSYLNQHEEINHPQRARG